MEIEKSTQLRHQKISLEEYSLSPLESTKHPGHPDDTPLSNYDKNGGSMPGVVKPGPIVPKPSSSSVQDKICPLSGKPYFTWIVTTSQIQSPFEMVIPKNFHPFLPSSSVPVILSCNNKTWRMTYYGDCYWKRLDDGWKEFAVDNNLKVGDGCVLELMDSRNLRCQVQILRGKIPDEVEDYGRKHESPIVIN